MRGILNQLRHFRREHATPTERPLVTLSAGNYGKAFAYLTSEFQHRLVLMPTTAPDNRQAVIEVCAALLTYLLTILLWQILQSISQHNRLPLYEQISDLPHYSQFKYDK